MRLSTIFELLLILLLVAFAAYGRVIDRDERARDVIRTASVTRQSDLGLSTMSLKQATDSVNRYCTCNENICNCCRDFHIPVVQLKGPGCASLQYLQGDNLAVQLSFGDNILTSTIVNGKSPRPVCVPLPGGFTKFCGRIYSIQRDAKNHFKACLGLELQSATELEASLRVSCFRFGPEGLKLRPAEPLPVVEAEASEEEDEDDFFGLGADDEDEDDEEEDNRPSSNSVPDASGIDAQEDDEEDEEEDPLGFSALFDIITGEDDTTKRPRVTTTPPLLEFTIPILTRPTTPTPLESYEATSANSLLPVETSDEEDITPEPLKLEEEEETAGSVETDTEDSINENSDEEFTESTNKISYFVKPDKVTTNKIKKITIGDKKKPSVTSTSINAIDEPEKPSKKPIKDENDGEEDDDDDDVLDDDEDDEDDVDEDKEDEDEDEEETDKLDNEKHEEQNEDDDDEKNEEFEDLDDDDDDEEEEEATVLSSLMGGDNTKKDKTNTNQTHQSSEEDDTDYGLDLEFLARKRHPKGSRQSRIMRF